MPRLNLVSSQSDPPIPQKIYDTEYLSSNRRTLNAKYEPQETRIEHLAAGLTPVLPLFFSIFLPQTLMASLLPPPQIIRRVHLPLCIRRPQIKALKRLWVARLRVGGNVSRHPFLPNRLADLFRLVRLVAVQLVGGVNPPSVPRSNTPSWPGGHSRSRHRTGHTPWKSGRRVPPARNPASAGAGRTSCPAAGCRF